VSGRRSPPAELRGTVLFVHGLWMTGVESFLLKRHLAAHGLRLRALPYSSLTESMEQVARRCARQVLSLAQRTLLPVHLVGHSLGGLVIYRAFETGLLPSNRFSGEACRVVFMGSPVRGSQSARALAGMRAARRLLGNVGGPHLPQGVPPHWPFAAQLGTIAGTRAVGLGKLLAPFNDANDGTVAVAETRLDGATDHCELAVSHTTMLLSAEVAGQVAAFLERGRFNRG
jgi:alpha-beta hydrolase superfamily lysophospholipase